MSLIEEIEGWNLADQLLREGRQVDQALGGVELVIANIERSAENRPASYRAGILKRIEEERHGSR